MTEPTPMVRLRNGAEEAKPLVAVTMASLDNLFESGRGLVVFDLVRICSDPEYKPFGVNGKILKDSGLASANAGTWHVHGSIRNIVLSAVSGEGLDMTIGNPITDEPQKS